MESKKLILVINPGSTSTKVALFLDKEMQMQDELIHKTEELNCFNTVNEQLSFRKTAVLDYLKRTDTDVHKLSAIAARGGPIGQLETGAYLVDEKFAKASLNSHHPHVSSLAAVIGYEIIKDNNLNINTFIYDAVSGCGTPQETFTLSGIPQIRRPFLTHVLNSRAVAIKQAQLDNKDLKDTSYIVVHMGGGITTNLICNGMIKDIVGDDEGCFSPERAGKVPCRALVKLCFSNKYKEEEIQKLLKGNGGIKAYLGTNDLRQVEENILKGDNKSKLVYESLILQIAKDIGSMSTVVCGKIDKIILTGGMANSKMMTSSITEKVSFLAPVSIINGTCEMEALANGILRVLNGLEMYHTL